MVGIFVGHPPPAGMAENGHASVGTPQASGALPGRADGLLVVDGGRIFLAGGAVLDPATGALVSAGHLAALDAISAEPLWDVRLDWLTFGRAGQPISTGSSVVVGDSTGNVAALDPANGATQWFLPRPAAPANLDAGSGAVSGDVLVTANAGRGVGLVNVASGAVLGALPLSAQVSDGAGPAVTAGRVYIVADNVLRAFGP